MLDKVKKSESPSGLTVGQTESFPHLGPCQSGDRVLQNCTDKTISPRSLVCCPLSLSMQSRIKVHKLLDENTKVRPKWDMYTQIFAEMDKRRITLKEICVIAESLGIPECVIKMRRNDLLKMA